MRQSKKPGDQQGKPLSLAHDALAQFHAGLRRYLLRRLHGAQDVEDLSQEVYLRLLRVGGERAVKHPQAYVYRVASNVLYEFKFHRKHGLVVFDSDATASAVEKLTDETLSPEDAYERSARERRLAAAIAQLSPMQRAVFLLAKHRDLSHEDIAAQLGISVNTARVHLHRALCHCREALRPFAP